MRPQWMIVFTAVLLAAVAWTSPASAWSNKEHILFTRLAVERLLADPATPPAMKTWLTTAAPDARDLDAERDWFLHARVGIKVHEGADAAGLPYWSTMPDTRAAKDSRDTVVAPFGVHERMLHFVDLELLAPDGVKGYRHDLSGKPDLADIPADIADPRWIKAGMLPFRIPDCYAKLVAAIKAGTLTESDGEDNAVKWGGYLAHYLADNTQPQHATIDYKSRSYFADPKTAPDVHGEMEYRMCDDATESFEDLRAAYWPLFIAAIENNPDPFADESDLFKATLEVSAKSYDALPLIGLAAMSASKQRGTPAKPVGPHGDLDTRAFFRFKGPLDGKTVSVMQMKAAQTAWAVRRIEGTLKRAWLEATGAR